MVVVSKKQIKQDINGSGYPLSFILQYRIGGLNIKI